MKTFGILISILLASLSIQTQAQTIRLPKTCRQILNKKFSGWKFADVPKDIKDYHKERKFPFEPNLIKGDWNGDGAKDYTVLIKPKKNSSNLAVAFLRTKTGYKHFVFEGGHYIQLFKKGEKDYSYDADKNFIYQNDAIFVGVGECCGSSYIWRRNKFVGVTTSD